MAKVRVLHSFVTRISPLEELTLTGFNMVDVARLCLFTKALDMNECDAPVSNNTNVG